MKSRTHKITPHPNTPTPQHAGSFQGWNTTDIYTLCIWSAYVDWSSWKAVNLPGVRPFSLAACNGEQSVNFVVYDMEKEEREGSLGEGRNSDESSEEREKDKSSSKR